MSDPIHTVPLFPRLAGDLLSFLRSLSRDEWELPTVLPTWRIRDIAAHLVDTAVRRLSGGRDRYRPAGPAPAISGYADLVSHVTALADEWVHAWRAVSPPVLVDVLEHLEPRLHAWFSALDPLAQARASVAWAGEATSRVWFDMAREYTERWHHQMQMREALGDLSIQAPELYRPVLQTFMRALPYHYRSVRAPEGTVLRVQIVGAAGGIWYLRCNGQSWQPSDASAEKESAWIELRQESAWRYFTKFGAEGVPASDVRSGGVAEVARHVLSMVCIIA